MQTGYDLQYNIAQILGNYSNYSTGMLGKWHLLDTTHVVPNCGPVGNINITHYLNCVSKVQETGFDFVDGLYIQNIPRSARNSHYSHNPEWMTYQGIRFMNQSHNNNKPWFLYVAHT